MPSLFLLSSPPSFPPSPPSLPSSPTYRRVGAGGDGIHKVHVAEVLGVTMLRVYVHRHLDDAKKMRTMLRGYVHRHLDEPSMVPMDSTYVLREPKCFSRHLDEKNKSYTPSYYPFQHSVPIMVSLH